MSYFENANITRNKLLRFTDKEMKKKMDFFPKQEKVSSIEGFKIQFSEFYTSSSKEEKYTKREGQVSIESKSTKDTVELRKEKSLKKSLSIKEKENESSSYLITIVKSLRKKRLCKKRKGTCDSYQHLDEIVNEGKKLYKRKTTMC